MKKLTYILLLFFTLNNLYAQDKGFSRWSIWAEYGYNYLDGDINQNTSSIFPSSFREITYGGGLEYAFSPVWGISADYAYFPLRAENTIPSQVNISTYLHAATLNATINFTRWIFPETKSKLHILGSIGLGYAYYEYFPIDRLTGITPTNVILNDEGRQVGQAGSVPVTFSAEYNFSHPLAIGAKFHYRAYTKDNLEGVSNLNWKGVTNDYIAAASVYLRYKLRSIKKNHVRNLRWQDYAPDLGLSTALEAKKEIAALTNKVNTVDKKVGEIDTKVEALDGKVNALTPRIENMEKFISNDGPDTDNDGVPDVRDRDNNTPTNTPVDFWGQTARAIPVSDNNKQSIEVSSEISAVYFDFDSYRLDDDAIIAISKVAMRLISDPTLFVEVRGYTDFSGNDSYNLKLSQRRAERVKKELVKEWEIDERRVIANPKGKDPNPPRKIYRPHRRCDFYFSK
ncbi:MAG: OmpA family protein [Paludibacteraceae bacterium]|nr:OmpA family protein [Paludibacteraceae bacterium]